MDANSIELVSLSYPDTITFFWHCRECGKGVRSTNSLVHLIDLSASTGISEADRKLLADFHISIQEDQ